jgi:type 1 glutamine amidotransferase
MKSLPNMISRRGIIQSAGLVSAAAILNSAPGFAASKIGTPRTLALIGDRFHNPDYIRVSLDKTFNELGIPVDYIIDYGALSADLLKRYALLVIHKDGMIWPGGYAGPDAYVDYQTKLENAADFPSSKPVSWITPEQGKAIKDFVSAGGGFYPMHNASDISLFNQDYRDVMGGAYVGHPPERPFQCRPTANAHPITAGIQPFMVTDEQHYVTYDKDPKNLILESVNVDGLTYEVNGKQLGTTSHAGWAYDYGRGRVVWTAVGHNIHANWNPQYLEIRKRSVRWLLKQI